MTRLIDELTDLKITKYVAMFYDCEESSFSTIICDTERQAQKFGGFGDFAGMTSVECIIPIEDRLY